MSFPSLPHRTFCMIRHGQTTANRDFIVAGETDVLLSDLGREQASQLASLEWPHETVLYVSPKTRAQDTCRLAFPGRSFEIHQDLRERNWGEFEGKLVSELPSRHAEPRDGETWETLVERVHNAITECCARTSSSTPSRLPVFVCHAGVIRAVMGLVGIGADAPSAPNAKPLFFRWTGAGHEMVEQI
ncbi:histidine phosphatase family protein [uncultured Cohaesibacter sp.]|uniref:histidine phosphatase family protein n=1 Tax=uncultured Cohaesibacter sp. TaxID=1002546 RepID=UPI0029C7E2CD|nr:histidine phosphatase family protein [uncultured Cohaesibacter sp.]